jgi:class 3 adenylate cyclase
VRQASAGSATFLFTDVEGATMLWEDHAADFEEALIRHDELLREAFAGHRGSVFASDGDGFGVVFEGPQDAVDAAVAAQRALAAEAWPDDMRLRARMGLETGGARERDGGYLGPVPNRAARIMAAAHGGQVLVGPHRCSTASTSSTSASTGCPTCRGPSASSRCTALRRSSRRRARTTRTGGTCRCPLRASSVASASSPKSSTWSATTGW